MTVRCLICFDAAIMTCHSCGAPYCVTCAREECSQCGHPRVPEALMAVLRSGA